MTMRAGKKKAKRKTQKYFFYSNFSGIRMKSTYDPRINGKGILIEPRINLVGI